MNWILVAGARPNFMKIAPLIRAIRRHNGSTEGTRHRIHYKLVHTGQHYDSSMSDSFFHDLALPEPDVHLGVGSGTHAEQTGGVLVAFEKVLFETRPDLVIVVGDVNSTLACALAAVKLEIPIAHVEAGLRSFDRRMPEEINRLVTDAVSDYLFTPSPDADDNLIREGIPPEKIFLVGDIMVDSLLFHLEKARKTTILERLGLIRKPQAVSNPQFATADSQSIAPYALLTLHRPGNVDQKESLSRIVRGLVEISSLLPVVFPIHPRTRRCLHEFAMESHFEFHAAAGLSPDDYYEGGRLKGKIHCFEPFGYLDFLNLMMHAKVVLTDSGGIQEETTVLNIPCVTLRDTTERPITLTEGTNVLVACDPERMVGEVRRVLEGRDRQGACPAIWDGHTAQRIVNILVERARQEQNSSEVAGAGR
jgi:UDP-N-acetylglucosamine 2-epimerase (non-hydrolysing)